MFGGHPGGDDALVLEAVRERDVDLVLVEEIHCSPEFARWLFERVWRPDGAIRWAAQTAVRVRHSVSHFDEGVAPGIGDDLMVRRGETDIEVGYTVPIAGSDLRLAVLLENKVDASFTDHQPVRYRSRARRLVAEDRYDQVRTVLTAPAAYLTGSETDEFDCRISYEEIRAFFSEQVANGDGEEPARRLDYRARLIDHAIHQFRRAGVTVVHTGITSFRQAYFERVQSLHPGLGMRQPRADGQWAGDYWMEFYDAFGAAPDPRGNIKHKCPHGRVDLQLSGWARWEDRVRPALLGLLEPDMRIRKAGKSLAVSIETPVVQPQAGFPNDTTDVDTGIEAVARLQAWYRRHQPMLSALGASLSGVKSL